MKAATGMAMSALSRVFATDDEPMCKKHGIRLRRMVPQGGWCRKDSLCPVCERRTVTMKMYPFKLYFSACGLIWITVILAVVFGAIPQISTAVRNHNESKVMAAAEVAKTIDTMPQEWAFLYRMLSEVHTYSRTEAFMDTLTGSREFAADKRSPILVSLPLLDPDEVCLFMGLFHKWERDEMMPIMAKLASNPKSP